MARLFPLASTLLVIAGLAGCVGPIGLDGRAVGVGLFRARHRDLAQGAACGRLEGVGLAIGPQRIALGFVSWRWVEVQVPDRPRRYHTPLGVIVIAPDP